MVTQPLCRGLRRARSLLKAAGAVVGSDTHQHATHSLLLLFQPPATATVPNLTRTTQGYGGSLPQRCHRGTLSSP
jgi:hypothetical protein